MIFVITLIFLCLDMNANLNEIQSLWTFSTLFSETSLLISWWLYIYFSVLIINYTFFFF